MYFSCFAIRVSPLISYIPPSPANPCNLTDLIVHPLQPPVSLPTPIPTTCTVQPTTAAYDPSWAIPWCYSPSATCSTMNPDGNVSASLVYSRKGATDVPEPHGPNTLHSSCADGWVTGPARTLSRIDVVTIASVPALMTPITGGGLVEIVVAVRPSRKHPTTLIIFVQGNLMTQ